MDLKDLRRVSEALSEGFKSHDFENETHEKVAEYIDGDDEYRQLLMDMVDTCPIAKKIADKLFAVLPDRTDDNFLISYSAVLCHVKRVRSEAKKRKKKRNGTYKR